MSKQRSVFQPLYYNQVKDRYDANRACLSQDRRIVRHATHILTGLGDAFTVVAQPAVPKITKSKG